VYDSLYIALALRGKFTLATLDARQARAASAEGVILKLLFDFI